MMHVTATTFAPGVTLLAASLFSLVVSMRAASVGLGSEHGVTLTDKLHMAGLAYAVMVAEACCGGNATGTGHAAGPLLDYSTAAAPRTPARSSSKPSARPSSTPG
jgi:hypothetical protein